MREAAEISGFKECQIREAAIACGLAVQMGRAWRIERDQIPEVIKQCRIPKKQSDCGKRPSNQVWYIRIPEGNRQISTGERDRGEAEKALARFIAEGGAQAIGNSAPDEMTVSAALEIYARDKADSVADPARIGYAMTPLISILGPVPLSRINGRACRQYLDMRGRTPATVRRELGVLQAALNHCNREGYLDRIIRLTLPPKTAPRDRWLLPVEAARLLRAAWRNPKAQHLARFILIALYTGTRSEAILSLQYGPNVNGGWVDLDQGVMYRRGVGKQETKKRTPPIVIPRPLLAHMRRWRRDGSRFVVHVEGCRVGRINAPGRLPLGKPT